MSKHTKALLNSLLNSRSCSVGSLHNAVAPGPLSIETIKRAINEQDKLEEQVTDLVAALERIAIIDKGAMSWDYWKLENALKEVRLLAKAALAKHQEEK